MFIYELHRLSFSRYFANKKGKVVASLLSLNYNLLHVLHAISRKKNHRNRNYIASGGIIETIPYFLSNSLKIADSELVFSRFF